VIRLSSGSLPFVRSPTAVSLALKGLCPRLDLLHRVCVLRYPLVSPQVGSSIAMSSALHINAASFRRTYHRHHRVRAHRRHFLQRMEAARTPHLFTNPRRTEHCGLGGLDQWRRLRANTFTRCQRSFESSRKKSASNVTSKC
jgi:hypothetical protein